MKLRIKNGNVELEFEGSEAFFKENRALFDSILSNKPNNSEDDSSQTESAVVPKKSTQTPLEKPINLSLTTSTLAARLKCEKAQDLILIAAGKIIVVDKKDRFTRKELLAEMNSALTHCEKSWTHNLGRFIGILMGQGKLNEVSKGIYCLTHSAQEEIKSKIMSIEN